MDNAVDTKILALELYMIKLKYESELRREESLIQQTGKMQSAFAFMTAAIFMVLPVIIQYRGIFSLELIIFIASTITIILLFSLFAATMAQNRRRGHTFPNAVQVMKHIEFFKKELSKDDVRIKYIIDTYACGQESLSLSNKKKVFWVRVSMRAFYLALTICLASFLFSVYYIMGGQNG